MISEEKYVQDYYPFGMVMPEREWANGNYRFGFNNQEKDDEWQGAGNIYAFEYRIHDPRLGRFLSVDPLFKNYPGNTPYCFADNSPIAQIDIQGLGPWPPVNPNSGYLGLAALFSEIFRPAVKAAPKTEINIAVAVEKEILSRTLGPFELALKLKVEVTYEKQLDLYEQANSRGETGNTTEYSVTATGTAGAYVKVEAPIPVVTTGIEAGTERSVSVGYSTTQEDQKAPTEEVTLTGGNENYVGVFGEVKFGSVTISEGVRYTEASTTDLMDPEAETEYKQEIKSSVSVTVNLGFGTYVSVGGEGGFVSD